MNQLRSASRIYPLIIALTAWLAVIVQFRLMTINPVAPAGELIVRFFSFFTILSNIAVAVSCTLIAACGPGKGRPGQSTLSAVAVYIFIVSLVYNGILRFLWAPSGLARVVDESLHVLVPVLYLVYWYLVIPRRQLPVAVIGRWLMFPIVYIICVLLRGNASGFYPYPFINVSKLGMQRALINSLGVAFLFVIVSFVIWFTGNRRAGKQVKR